jgi:hypothetical protein
MLNVGKKDGVRTGMRFYAEQESKTALRSSFFVISLGDRECELLQRRDAGQERVKPGLRLTTTDPAYDEN